MRRTCTSGPKAQPGAPVLSIRRWRWNNAAQAEARSVFEIEGQGGERVSRAIELQVEARREMPRFAREAVDESSRSRELADAINEAEFGLCLLAKPNRSCELAKADHTKWCPDLIAEHDAPPRGIPPSIEGVLFRKGQYFFVDRQCVVALDSFGAQVSSGKLNAKYLLSPSGNVSAQFIKRGRTTTTPLHSDVKDFFASLEHVNAVARAVGIIGENCA